MKKQPIPAGAPAGTTVETPAALPAWIAKVRAALRTPKARLIIRIAQYVLSLFSILYTVGIIKLAYRSIFYRLEIPTEHRAIFCVLVSLICLGSGILLIFTRKIIIPRICIMISMPFHLPIFLFNYENLVLLIPLGILVVVTYFLNGVSEGTKTILGAFYLMIYVLGVFLYFVVQNVMAPASEETIVEQGISPGGDYRYAIVEVTDQAEGSTYLSMEPTRYDQCHDHYTWYAKGYDKLIYLERPKTTFTLSWETQIRTAITQQLLALNPDISFVLDAEELQAVGKSEGYFEMFEANELTKAQRAGVGLCIQDDLKEGETPESLGLELCPDSEPIKLSFATMQRLGMSIAANVKLSELTDENLAALGVPAESDVLSINGKVIFRYYVAELEGTFDPDVRTLTGVLDIME